MNAENRTPAGFTLIELLVVIAIIFGTITAGGTWSAEKIPDCSNHVKSDAEPYGGNIGFLDGHVEWRPFQDMEERYDTNPCFFW